MPRSTRVILTHEQNELRGMVDLDTFENLPNAFQVTMSLSSCSSPVRQVVREVLVVLVAQVALELRVFRRVQAVSREFVWCRHFLVGLAWMVARRRVASCTQVVRLPSGCHVVWCSHRRGG